MYCRIQFEDGQQITKKEMAELNSTLSDNVEFDKIYLKSDDGKMKQFYSWQETLDPNDKELLPDEKGVIKKKLVFETDYVELSVKKEYICDIELFFSKHPNLKIKMRGMPKTVDRDYTNMIEMIIKIQEKFETALKNFDQQIEFNQKCDVHIGNIGLLSINEVALLEDSCTDDLQKHLSNGWRIIASNPQPDQRRPDYILGRYNPDMDSKNTKAVRL